MIVIDCNPAWMLELAWLVAILAELGHEREAFVIVITREYLHSLVVGIDDHQEISMMIEHQALRRVERAIIMALLDGANRALDSRIDIVMVRLIEMIAHVCNTHAQLQQRYRPTLHETHTTENEMLGCLKIRDVRAMTVRETDTHTQRERQTRCEHERDTKQQRPRSPSNADAPLLTRTLSKGPSNSSPS